MTQPFPAAYAPLSQRPPPRVRAASVALVAGAGTAAALVAVGLAAVGLSAALPGTLPVAATSAMVVAAVALAVLGRVTADGCLRCMAWGYAAAASVTLVGGLGVQDVARGVAVIGRTAGAGVAIVPLGLVVLPAFAVAAVLGPSRRWLRGVLAAVVAAGLVAYLVDPTLSALPPALDDQQRFTPTYRVLGAGAVVWCLAGALVWHARSGRRPTWTQLWVGVGLALLAGSAVAHLLAEQPASSMWWAGHVLQVLSGAVPAVGLCGGLLDRVATLERRERALADRLNLELTEVLDGHVEAAADRRDLEQRFDRVQSLIDTGALSIVLQPIYDLRDGRVLGFEALARFDGPPAQPPDVWFDDAASVGWGVDLELAAVAAALPRLHDLPGDAYLAVNVSPDTLTSPRLAALFDTVDATRLVVEVTEHAPISDYERVTLALERLKARGVRLAVDDVGAGFSSLRHVVRLGPAIMKLDMSLTRDIHRDPVRRSLAASLVAFAEDNRITLVAEGIESEPEFEQLRELGVTAGQGYLLCRPEAFPAPSAPVRVRPSATGG